MAEAALNFCLESLKQLLFHESTLLVVGLRDEIGSLYEELNMLNCFLKDYAAADLDSEWLTQVRDVVYEVENVIDQFVYDATKSRCRICGIERLFFRFNYISKAHSLASDSESFRKKFKELFDYKRAFQLREYSSSSFHFQDPRDPFQVPRMVGFKEDEYDLLHRLLKGTERREVVSVVGMAGIGKTTLAKTVFNSDIIRNHFDYRSWVCVSQEFEINELILSILRGGGGDFSTNFSSEKDLGVSLYKSLRGRRYLIVLDDVWNSGAWDVLRKRLPNDNNGSRILLTSRFADVALDANPDKPPYQLRFLTPEDSWELFCRKVFPTERLHPVFEDLGKKIISKCGGLPPAIVAIAGVLRLKETPEEWTMISNNINLWLVGEGFRNVLALSYKPLTFFLKSCFLYFAAFPEDFEIPVSKLLQLWVAEGFIEQSGQACLEDRAQKYLEDLVGRNLILATKRRYDGRIKTCRIHNTLRELCLAEAIEEHFLWEIKGNARVPRETLPRTDRYCRRICIHSHVWDYMSSRPFHPYIRSFLCFVQEPTELQEENVSFIPKAFKLLRVLDIMPIRFPHFPDGIVRLVLLRYLALSGCFKALPASISGLQNLQTLIVETNCRSLDIPADIWKLLNLQHLYTSGSGHLHKPHAKLQKDTEGSLEGRNMQTLSMVSPNSCLENILARTPNLKKLGISGELVTLLEEKEGYCLFDNLAKLNHLETLKLFNDTFPNPPSQSKLPQWYKFPPNLRKLTLSDTLLDWQHMSILGMLPYLEVLKLKDNAFNGQLWEPLDGGFGLLKVLQIGRTDLVQWKASSDHFPCLECLVLKHCESLEAIPSGLGDVPALQIIELYSTSSSAVDSARLIQQKIQSKGNKGLKLLVYPHSTTTLISATFIGSKDAR